VPEGCIMVTLWPHYLSVAKVKRVREGSIYAPQLFNIQMWSKTLNLLYTNFTADADVLLQTQPPRRLPRRVAGGTGMWARPWLLIWH